jgi:hypothetical protein
MKSRYYAFLLCLMQAACRAPADRGPLDRDGPAALPPDACATDAALECRLGTSCVAEGDATSCEYSEPTPWLALEGGDPSVAMTVAVLPLGLAGSEQPEVLRLLPKHLPLNSFRHWSPSGRILVFDEGWADLRGAWENRLAFAEFGRGLPSEAQVIQNLPSGTSYYPEDWDPETDAMATIGGPEAYVVRFENGDAIAELAATSEDDHAVELCRGARALVHQIDYDASAWLLPLGSARETSEPRLIGFLASVSPDRRRVAVLREGPGDRTQLLVGDCAADAELAVVAEHEGLEQITWSPNSQTFLAASAEGVHHVFEVNATGAHRAFEELNGTASWFQHGRALLLSKYELSGQSWSFVDLDTMLSEALPINSEASATVCGKYVLIREPVDATERERISVLEPGLDGAPRRVLDLPSEELSQLSPNPACTRLVYVREDPYGKLTLGVVHLATDGHRPFQRELPEGEFWIERFPDGKRGLFASYTAPEALLPSAVWYPLTDDDLEAHVTFSGFVAPVLQP